MTFVILPFYHLDLSMTLAKLMKKGCPRRGQLLER